MWKQTWARLEDEYPDLRDRATTTLTVNVRMLDSTPKIFVVVQVDEGFDIMAGEVVLIKGEVGPLILGVHVGSGQPSCR